MLSLEDNELLTRVGPKTPMGNLIRHYWIPFLFSWEVEPNGKPERVRLLGEDLVAFRDTNGNIGLLAERCPHRGASLYFGRNEEAGLRCIYHGWKFDTTGACVDMPNEPDESNFKTKVHQPTYPCVERAGVVWTYMGPAEEPPPLPGLEWMDLPESHIVASKRVQYSNWVQGMEGDIDQSHVSFVHSRLNVDEPSGVGDATGNRTPIRQYIDRIRAMDKHPKFQVLETDYGVLIGAGRQAPDDQEYWRVTQHLMPFHTMTGPYGPNPTRNWRAWVPIDDTNVFVIGLSFHPSRPLSEEERDRHVERAGVWNISPENRAPVTSAPFGRWRPLLTMENDFHQDRADQQTKTYSGIAEFWAQDAAPQLSMGEICDRTIEHLGTSDSAIIAVRRKLLKEAKALRDYDHVPDEVYNPDVYRVRSDALVISKGESWVEATTERRQVLAGVNPDCA